MADPTPIGTPLQRLDKIRAGCTAMAESMRRTHASNEPDKELHLIAQSFGFLEVTLDVIAELAAMLITQHEAMVLTNEASIEGASAIRGFTEVQADDIREMESVLVRVAQLEGKVARLTREVF